MSDALWSRWLIIESSLELVLALAGPGKLCLTERQASVIPSGSLGYWVGNFKRVTSHDDMPPGYYGVIEAGARAAVFALTQNNLRTLVIGECPSAKFRELSQAIQRAVGAELSANYARTELSKVQRLR